MLHDAATPTGTWTPVFDRGYCVNLRRRPYRWYRSEKQLAALGLPVQRAEAVDGADLDLAAVDVCSVTQSYDTTENAAWDRHVRAQEQRRMSRGEVGCALSHVALWRRVALECHAGGLILEDDVTFDRQFGARLREAWSQLPAGWEILYLGYVNPGSAPRPVSTDLVAHTFLFGTFAYLLHPRGARRLLSRLPVVGPLDLFLGCQLSSLQAYAITEPIVRHACAWEVDSDVVHSARGPLPPR